MESHSEGGGLELVSISVEPVTTARWASILLWKSHHHRLSKAGLRSLLGFEEPLANSRLSFTFRS